MSDLYCPIRKSWCKALPEEEVRISLVSRMISQLGFPSHTLLVEKDLRSLPHLTHLGAMPDRRADILCFAKGIHPSVELYPLLMIECKAVKITESVLQQVMGYNYYVQSFFICVANQQEVRTGWKTAAGKYEFVAYLPSYAQLKQSIGLGTP